MSRLSRRVRLCTGAAVVATGATLAAVVPGGGVAAGATSPSVRHASVQSAVDRLPNYFPGVVHWRVSLSSKHYATTNWDTNTITVSAFTPLSLLYSVVAHEWSHEVQAYDYHRDFWGIVRSMNRHFGGAGSSGQRGVEYAADCMAILQGATWTDYTSCHNTKWRHYAKRLLAGHMLRNHGHHKTTGTSTIPVSTSVTTSPSNEPTTKPTAKPKPQPTSYPEPEPYPRPDQYTITWTG